VIERVATCRRCRRPVRLLEDELVDQRGLCAVCDARFDLMPESFLGEGPLRALAIVGAAELEHPPHPGVRLIEIDST
jgi:hypothetical protein